MIKNERVKISDKNECDVQVFIDEVILDIRTKYGKDSPKYVLWQEQK